MAAHPVLTLAGSCAALAAGIQPAQAEGSVCLLLTEPVAAGAYLTARQASETPCREERPRLPFTYDRAARAPMSHEAMPAGTYLGRIVLDEGAIAVPGQALHLRIGSGPVIIEREVRTLRAARSGDRTLLRTSDGQVIEARFVAAEADQ